MSQNLRIFSLFYYLCFIFIFSVDLYASTPGKIIILYGLHCGGKSTLIEELVKQLPEKYDIIRKSQLLAEKRMDNIEKLTGKRLKKCKDISKITHLLPQLYRKKTMGSTSEAIRETLLKIKSRAERGKNSIYAVCVRSTEKLKILEGTTFYSVLVYAPISEVSKRELKRTYHYTKKTLYSTR